MASLIAKALVKTTLSDVAKKNINSEDPYHIEVDAVDRHGRPTGKTKRQKRPLPNGLSRKDQMILEKVRKRAYKLDMSLFNCCGIRFGWSSVVGLFPVIGDVMDMLMALSLVRKANQVDEGLPNALRARMMLNIIIDFAVGLIPFIGDVADGFYKANTRNAWLLEVYLTKKAQTKRGEGIAGLEVPQADVGNPQPMQQPSKPQPARLPSAGGSADFPPGTRNGAARSKR